MHGLRLSIRGEALPTREIPRFQGLEELAGLMSQQTWLCNRIQLTLKSTIDVPLLGPTIEQNGDGQWEDSLMPVGWPLHIDGAVKQYCLHRENKLQVLSNVLRFPQSLS